MPFYEYQPVGEQNCDYCVDGFEQLQKLDAKPLCNCPECGSDCQRVISAPSMHSGQSHVLKPQNLEKKGFTQYRKTSKGQYEKTAGKGPRYLSDSD